MGAAPPAFTAIGTTHDLTPKQVQIFHDGQRMTIAVGGHRWEYQQVRDAGHRPPTLTLVE